MPEIRAARSSGIESKSAPYYVKACALGIPAYLIGVHLWTWILTVRVFLNGRADFRQLYAAGYMIRTGHRFALYDFNLQQSVQNYSVGPSDTPLPFNHLSYESLLFAPLSAFSYAKAYFIFLGINCGLLVVCYYILSPWTQNLRKLYRWLPAALYASFLPIAAALIQGQDSILLLALLAGAYSLIDAGHDLRAGWLIGLALFKFQIAIPIALLFLLWRRWRFCGGFVLSGTTVLLFSTWLVGPEQMRFYAHWLLSMSTSGNASDYARSAIYPAHMANLRGLLFGVAGVFPNFFIQVATCILSLALLFWVAARPEVRFGSRALLVAVPAASLASYHLFIHDLSILMIPCLVTLNQFIGSEPTGSFSEKLALRSAAGVLLAPLAESFFPDHFFLVSLPILVFLLSLLLAESWTVLPTHASLAQLG